MLEPFQSGKDLEDRFEQLLKDNKINYKRNFYTENKLQIDFMVDNTPIEITLQSSPEKIQQLCFRMDSLHDNGYFPTVCIFPIDKITNRSIKWIKDSIDFIFDVNDLQNVIDLIKVLENDAEEIWQNNINNFYIKQLDRLSKKNEIIFEFKKKWLEEFRDNTKKQIFTPHDLSQSTGLKIKEQDLEKLSQNVEFIISQIYKRPFWVLKAKEFLLRLKKKGFIEAKTDLYKELGLTYSQYYDTLLRKLKGKGLIRKEKGFYVLNSKYSFQCIKNATIWIEFAEIKRNQPKKLARILLTLFGLDYLLEK